MSHSLIAYMKGCYQLCKDSQELLEYHMGDNVDLLAKVVLKNQHDIIDCFSKMIESIDGMNAEIRDGKQKGK